MNLRWCLAIAIVSLSIAASHAQAATLAGPPTYGYPNQPWGTRRPVTAADRVAVARYRSGTLKPAFASDFTDAAALTSQWQLRSDDYLKSCRRPENVVATASGLELQTRVAEDCRARWSTGSMISTYRQKFGFFEATIKAADISGLNNAFWLVTSDHFEIDIAEIHYPNVVNLTLHDNNRIDGAFPLSVGFKTTFVENLSNAYHDYGALWTPSDIIYEVDGEPVAAIHTDDAIHDAADIRLSTALMDYAGTIPSDPVGHDMYVKSVRVIPL